MAMGAWRIAQVGVLTRRASAIESMGAATVLCTDKTGTLTQNRMVAAGLWMASGETADLGAGMASDRFGSEEHTSELQSLMRISYAVFCLKKKKTVKLQ